MAAILHVALFDRVDQCAFDKRARLVAYHRAIGEQKFEKFKGWGVFGEDQFDPFGRYGAPQFDFDPAVVL